MATRPNALTTLAVCKAQLDIPISDTSQDALLERYIDSSSEQIERYCNRKFASATYTEHRDGSRSNELILKNFPITSITSVSVDGERLFASNLASTDYAMISPNVLRRHSGTWGSGSQTIKVVYVAGYTAIPADLEDACTLLVELRYAMKSDRRIGRTSSGKQGESVSYTAGWPQEVLSILDSYKVYPFITEEMARLV